MAAIAAAAARDARRARQVRTAVAAGTVVATAAGLYAGAGWAVGFVSAALLRVLDLVIALVVRMAEASQSGGGIWGVLSSLGRATSALAADTSVTIALIAISAVAIAGLVALQRLLGSDEESFP
jgi:hypothetical protein